LSNRLCIGAGPHCATNSRNLAKKRDQLCMFAALSGNFRVVSEVVFEVGGAWDLAFRGKFATVAFICISVGHACGDGGNDGAGDAHMPTLVKELTCVRLVRKRTVSVQYMTDQS
jgi:hypothetical protein